MRLGGRTHRLQPEPKRATIGDTELAYIQAGDGSPIVFVHGTLGDYRSWQMQVGPFSERHKCVAYSRRYHWPNRWTGDGLDYSAALHAEDLAALVDSLKLARVHVVSASYGSYVALVHAARYPAQVRTLVIAEPPMLRWLDEMEGGRQLGGRFETESLHPAFESVRQGSVEEGIRRFIDGVHGKVGSFDRFPERVRAQLLDNAQEFEAEARSERMFPHFVCEDAHSVSIPVLLLTGELSPPHFHRITAELARCLPYSEWHSIPGSSHAMNAERPRTYNRIVLDFLAGHDA